jgi:hypothetical protein
MLSAYARQVGHNENTKREFQEVLKDLVRSVPSDDKLFIGGENSIATWIYLTQVLKGCMGLWLGH